MVFWGPITLFDRGGFCFCRVRCCSFFYHVLLFIFLFLPWHNRHSTPASLICVSTGSELYPCISSDFLLLASWFIIFVTLNLLRVNELTFCENFQRPFSSLVTIQLVDRQLISLHHLLVWSSTCQLASFACLIVNLSACIICLFDHQLVSLHHLLVWWFYICPNLFVTLNLFAGYSSNAFISRVPPVYEASKGWLFLSWTLRHHRISPLFTTKYQNRWIWPHLNKFHY